MTVRLSPEADADLGEIFAWYAERGTTLGLELLASFSDVLDQIDAFPESGPLIHQGIRRVLMHRFPYCIFYYLETSGPVVLGCFHAHRDARVWRVRAGL